MLRMSRIIKVSWSRTMPMNNDLAQTSPLGAFPIHVLT